MTLLAVGFEEALIGYGNQFNNHVAIYDREKCINILMQRDGMDLEEAEEYFEYNVQGSYVGKETPVFLNQKENRFKNEL
tara:strand:+ start:407 stop:643 length:237 start_codon:yes stop_codon:yes gene_type:complete